MCWRVVPFRCILKIYMWFNSTRGLEGTFFLQFFPPSLSLELYLPNYPALCQQQPLDDPKCIWGLRSVFLGKLSTDCTALQYRLRCTQGQGQLPQLGPHVPDTRRRVGLMAAPEHGPLEQPWSCAPSLLQQGGLCLLCQSAGQDKAQL